MVAVVAGAIMVFGYLRLPNLLFGVGHYEVTVQLPEAGGLYERGNVTYRGTEVGQVKSVHLTDTGVEAVLSLRSDVKIPSNLDAEVHSQSAVGEQYVALLPRNDGAPPLKDGDVIPVSRTTVPPDINSLLDSTNRGLQAIPQGNLKTVIDESYTAFGGLGPDISRLVRGSTTLAIDARKNLDPLLALIDGSRPVLDSQTDTADSVSAWASHLAAITTSLQRNDPALRGVIQNAGPAAEEVRGLFERVKPTLPILLANLVSLNQVAITYQPDIEQLLVLLPQGTAAAQAVGLANRNTKQAYKGIYLSFNLNFNLPSSCTTGFLPANQQRVPADTDYPERPAGDLYCRVPQDSPLNVRGARNTPCETVPGKRAPTVKMCESNENYEPLNDGFNWKGDPNATLSGQPVPQPPPKHRPPPPHPHRCPPSPPPGTTPRPVPTSGRTGGCTRNPTWPTLEQEHTWQSMLLPPPGS